jgi:hypothetical protein
MKNYKLEVHWIIYQNKYGGSKNGEQGWATVRSDNYNDWIFYGNETYNDMNLPHSNGFEHAVYQAKLTNRYNGYNESVKIVGKEESIRARYKPYQWMDDN